MKLKPPILLECKPLNIKRYYGRISGFFRCSKDTTYDMTIWEWFGKRKGWGKTFNALPTINKIRGGKVSVSGVKATIGSPAAIWTWEEKHNGIIFERVHIEVLD